MVQYDDFAESFGRSRDNLHWPEIDRVLTAFVETHSSGDTWKIGDIGCGNGRLLEHISADIFAQLFCTKKVSYTGLDLSEQLLEQAKKKNHLFSSFHETVWLQGNMLDIADLCEGRTFDGLFFVASFHHLTTREERLSVLRHSRNLLAPGGRIMMINWNLLHENQTRYRPSLTHAYDSGGADFMIKIGEHERFYHAFSQDEYESLSQESELTLELIEFGERNSICIFCL